MNVIPDLFFVAECPADHATLAVPYGRHGRRLIRQFVFHDFWAQVTIAALLQALSDTYREDWCAWHGIENTLAAMNGGGFDLGAER